MPKKVVKDVATLQLEEEEKQKVLKEKQEQREAKKFTDSKRKSISYWVKKLNYVMGNEIDMNKLLSDDDKADKVETLLSDCVEKLSKYC